MKVSLICISLLFRIFVGCHFLRLQADEKVAAARREVVDTNTLLQELNEELRLQLATERDEPYAFGPTISREEYIGRYMDQCSTYLDKMDLYRRS